MAKIFFSRPTPEHISEEYPDIFKNDDRYCYADVVDYAQTEDQVLIRTNKDGKFKGVTIPIHNVLFILD